jgi:hypothetical protein
MSPDAGRDLRVAGVARLSALNFRQGERCRDEGSAALPNSLEKFQRKAQWRARVGHARPVRARSGRRLAIEHRSCQDCRQADVQSRCSHHQRVLTDEF